MENINQGDTLQTTDAVGLTETAKVHLTMYTYKEGGSMICDESKVSFEKIPTRLQIKRILETYRRVHNYKGRVFYTLRGHADEEAN